MKGIGIRVSPAAPCARAASERRAAGRLMKAVIFSATAAKLLTTRGTKTTPGPSGAAASGGAAGAAAAALAAATGGSTRTRLAGTVGSMCGTQCAGGNPVSITEYRRDAEIVENVDPAMRCNVVPVGKLNVARH